MVSDVSAGASDTSVCPAALAWCNDHVGDLHQRRIGDAAGQLQVVLERQDHDGAAGRPQLSFRFCADGELIDDSTEFTVDMILEVLRSADCGR